MPHQVLAAAAQLIQAGFVIGGGSGPGGVGVGGVLIVAEDEGYSRGDTGQGGYHKALQAKGTSHVKGISKT